MSHSTPARAGLVSLGGTGVLALVQLVSLVVLARLLDPTDFGVYAMAMTFIGFTALFRDLGLSAAAVQTRHLSVQLRTNLWWINATVGLGLTLISLLAAPLMASFYSEPDVALVVILLSPTLLLAGLAIQYRASLTRDMRFGFLAAWDVVGAVLGLVVAIVIALRFGGVLALVLPQLIAGAVTAIGVIWGSHWLPGLPRRGQGTRKVIDFGIALFVAQVLTYAHRNYDAVLLGRLHGAHSMGAFNRATQMTRMPIGMLAGPFGRVALAVMSPHQDRPDALAALARKGQVLLALPILMTAGLLVATAEPLVQLALGPGWASAVPFVRLIAASEALALMASVGGWIISARGLGGRVVQLGVLSTVVKLTLISLGALWGPYGIVAGVLVSQLVLWPLSLTLVGRMTQLSIRTLLLDSLFMVAVFGTATAAGTLAGEYWRPDNLWVHLVVTAGVMIGVLAALLALPKFRHQVTSFVTVVRSAI